MFISDLFHLNIQTHITVDAGGAAWALYESFLVELPKSSLDSLDDGLGSNSSGTNHVYYKLMLLLAQIFLPWLM